MKTSKSLHWSVFSLILGLTIGAIGFSPVSADDPSTAPSAVVPVGEILKVCIDLKTGIIRAATKCAKNERATVLGGVGPKGPVGPQGPQGSVGPQGATGPVGPQGTVFGLHQVSVTTYIPSTIGGFCSSFGYSALSQNTSISVFGSTISLNKNCINFNPSTVTVYGP